MSDTIKCGRITYDLEDGDTIMDNGACFQLISRSVRSGWNNYSPPRVSKKAFKDFKDNSNVSSTTEHTWGDNVVLYIYKKEL